MSTKVYNGFRIGGLSMTQLHNLVGEFRQKATYSAETMLAQFVAQRLADVVDGAMVEGKALPENVYRTILNEVRERQIKVEQTMRRDPAVDFSFNLSFTPMEEGDILGIFYTEKSELANLWRSMPGIEDYAYWNNSDKPDGVTEEQWDERGRRWEDAVGSSPVSMKSFTADVVPSQFWYVEGLEAKVAQIFPSEQARLTSMAQAAVVSQIMAQAADTDEAYTLYSMMGRWLRSPLGVERVEVMKLEVATVLEPTLTHYLPGYPAKRSLLKKEDLVFLSDLRQYLRASSDYVLGRIPAVQVEIALPGNKFLKIGKYLDAVAAALPRQPTVPEYQEYRYALEVTAIAERSPELIGKALLEASGYQGVDLNAMGTEAVEALNAAAAERHRDNDE